MGSGHDVTGDVYLTVASVASTWVMALSDPKVGCEVMVKFSASPVGSDDPVNGMVMVVPALVVGVGSAGPAVKVYVVLAMVPVMVTSVSFDVVKVSGGVVVVVMGPVGLLVSPVQRDAAFVIEPAARCGRHQSDRHPELHPPGVLVVVPSQSVDERSGEERR